MTLEIFDVFDAAWRVSWQAAAIVSLVAGVTSHHLIFRRFEVDGYAWQLLFIFLGSSAVLIIAHIRIGGYSLILAICRALLVSNAYNAGVVVSSLTYRAFFHPLNRFPGPFMAKLSRFYAMRNAAKSLKAFEDIQRLHETYGDIVRVGEYQHAFLHRSPRNCLQLLSPPHQRQDLVSYPSIAHLP